MAGGDDIGESWRERERQQRQRERDRARESARRGADASYPSYSSSSYPPESTTTKTPPAIPPPPSHAPDKEYPPPHPHSNSGLLPAIIIPPIVVLFALAALCLYLSKRRKKRRKSTSRNRSSTLMAQLPRSDEERFHPPVSSDPPPIIISDTNNAYLTGLDTSSQGSQSRPASFGEDEDSHSIIRRSWGGTFSNPPPPYKSPEHQDLPPPFEDQYDIPPAGYLAQSSRSVSSTREARSPFADPEGYQQVDLEDFDDAEGDMGVADGMRFERAENPFEDPRPGSHETRSGQRWEGGLR